METIEINIYEIHELNDKAKERARNWYREGFEYHWWDEAKNSIRTFIEHFGGAMQDWQLGERGRDYIKTDITPAHFRGKKLSDFSPDFMPTGYCFDCDLWETFHKEWKRTSDPMYAFEQALEATMSAIASDIEYQYSNEAIDESISANGYRFTEDGRFYQ